MCGIVGYKGKPVRVKDILDTLKMLEYRGYDSAGLAYSRDGILELRKVEGKIEKLYGLVDDSFTDLVIAHTRWATHGIPNDINAHPHVVGTLAVVHNGIIENYREIKNYLNGYQFKSETDSEVIVHLVNYFYKDNLFDSILASVKFLKGAFAFVLMDTKSGDLVAVKMESPIVIGLIDGGYIVSSDIPSIIKWTRRIITLENGDIFYISSGDFKIFNFIENRFVRRNIEIISWDLGIAEKSGYKHFMLKEINEQGKVIRDTIAGRIEKNEIILDEEVRNYLDSTDIRNIVYIACGTSYHAGLVGVYYSLELAGLNSHAVHASEYRYIDKSRVSLDDTLFVFISQSGETADTLSVARELKGMKAKILAIPNVIGSSMYREFLSFPTRAGVEIGVAATKTFTAQLINLLLLNLYLAKKKNIQIDGLVHEILTIHEFVDSILESYDQILELAQEYSDYQHFMYLGRHLMYPIALEGALKLKEISYIHAEAYPAGEMKHGPIALIDNKMPTFYLYPYNRLVNKNLSNIQEIKARKGKVIALVDKKTKEIAKDIVDRMIEIRYVNEYLQPILAVIPLQLFAYYIADWKGFNVDQPRNLAKSVTVE
ncbi:MAG: glutamine--fructose-6-phosphate transaminase (isomerizing) [Candidatus Calescibacterium sp.]|nr:glutamine--fructose-6-phosphate transaminase (isomerizing) [Candidatus Calescibacterium sp.]MCX7972315.1 glutamine--fructose-6-phosphate transaminase (isomerizing) [bacterium]MDW8195081.1 glutamine--fructose-6-phosphate transaminase (isomerizing) [Candidatus Calescibacterium sp.]